MRVVFLNVESTRNICIGPLKAVNPKL